MEGWICLGVAIALGLPIAACLALSRLFTRVGELERRLDALRGEMERLRSLPGGPADRPAPPARTPPPVTPSPHATPPTPPTPRRPTPPLAPTPRAHAGSPLYWEAPQTTKPPGPTSPTAGHTPPPPAAAVSSERIETQVWTRGLIWVAAAALFLAVAFFVKYTFDAGLITPEVRVILGLAFGGALLAAGEGLRQREPRIAVGLVAAGVAALFVSILAATTLYHFVSDLVGFVGLAGVSGLAVALALRHGPLVAVLGLIGGYLTPALIGSPEPRAAPLFGYLFLLALALAAVARRRGWWWLAPLMLVGALGWTALWLGVNYHPPDSRWLGGFLIGTSVLFVAALPRRVEDVPQQFRDMFRAVALLGPTVVMLTLAWLVDASGYDTLDWSFLGLLGVAAIALARFEPRYGPLPWLAAAIIAAMLLARAAQLHWQPDARLLATAASLGGALALSAYAALWGATRPALWAMLSGIVAAIYFVLCCLAHHTPPGDVNWGWLGLLAAGAYVGLSTPVALHRARMSDGDRVLTILLGASAALLALGILIGPPPAWRSLAWGAEAAALLLAAWMLRLPDLRKAVAVVTVLCVAGAFDPEAMRLPDGTSPVLNRLLLSHGLPALVLAACAVGARRAGGAQLSHGLAGGVLLLVWLLVTLEVRHYFHGEAMLKAAPRLRDTSALVSAWLMMTCALQLAEARWAGDVLRIARRALLAAAIGLAVLFLGLVRLPLWCDESVGATPVFNALLWVYGLPALLLIVLGLLARRAGEIVEARWVGGVALATVFLLVTLEVRQGFHGDRLDLGRATNAEWYAYSLAWVLLGVLLLVLAIATRWALLRWASLVVMLAAVAKVFLVDAAALRDLYRVFSFLGLGASLMLLAWLYQRFVFRRSAGGR